MDGELPEKSGGLMTETVFILPENLTRERWTDIGRTLLVYERAAMWWLGDWFAYGERTFGDDCYQAVPEYANNTVRIAEWVARSIPPEERRADLPFSFHQVVAALDPAIRIAILASAAEERWTRTELRAAVRYVRDGAAGEAPSDPPEGVLSRPIGGSAPTPHPGLSSGQEPVWPVVELPPNPEGHILLTRRSIAYLIEQLEAGKTNDVIGVLLGVLEGQP